MQRERGVADLGHGSRQLNNRDTCAVTCRSSPTSFPERPATASRSPCSSRGLQLRAWLLPATCAAICHEGPICPEATVTLHTTLAASSTGPWHLRQLVHIPKKQCSDGIVATLLVIGRHASTVQRTVSHSSCAMHAQRESKIYCAWDSELPNLLTAFLVHSRSGPETWHLCRHF